MINSYYSAILSRALEFVQTIIPQFVLISWQKTLMVWQPLQHFRSSSSANFPRNICGKSAKKIPFEFLVKHQPFYTDGQVHAALLTDPKKWLSMWGTDGLKRERERVPLYNLSWKWNSTRYIFVGLGKIVLISYLQGHTGHMTNSVHLLWNIQRFLNCLSG